MKKLLLLIAAMTMAVCQAFAQNDVIEAPDDSIYGVVDEVASFPGGNAACYAWLSENIKYPKAAYKQGIQGTVVVQFVINKDGSVSNLKVLRSSDSSLADEAVRVVKKMPKWTPARLNGKIVRMYIALPIRFYLQREPEKKQTAKS